MAAMYRFDVARLNKEIMLSGRELQDIAEAAGLRPGTVSALLRRNTARPATVVKVAKALGLDPAELLMGPKQPAEKAEV